MQQPSQSQNPLPRQIVRAQTSLGANSNGRLKTSFDKPAQDSHNAHRNNGSSSQGGALYDLRGGKRLFHLSRKVAQTGSEQNINIKNNSHNLNKTSDAKLSVSNVTGGSTPGGVGNVTCVMQTKMGGKKKGETQVNASMPES